MESSSPTRPAAFNEQLLQDSPLPAQACWGGQTTRPCFRGADGLEGTQATRSAAKCILHSERTGEAVNKAGTRARRIGREQGM